jgi:hypothetical protein
MNKQNTIYEIRLNHAVVLNCSVGEFERILDFINSSTNAKVIYQRHSMSFLKIIETDLRTGNVNKST